MRLLEPISMAANSELPVLYDILLDISDEDLENSYAPQFGQYIPSKEETEYAESYQVKIRVINYSSVYLHDRMCLRYATRFKFEGPNVSAF